jgi:tRNA modification GTPase
MTSIDGNRPIEAALVTPIGDGGISVVAVRGPGAAALVSSRLNRRSSPGASFLPGHLYYGFFADSAGGVLDEVIVACVTPDFIEISCHGGIVPARRVLNELAASGVSAAGPASVRAFGLDAPDFVTGEALAALCEATTDLSARVLAAQSGGLLSHELRGILADLDDPSTARRAGARLKSLLDTAALGIALRSPPTVVVVGPANAGKSSIVNRLSGYERSIVTDVPGTTRDCVSVLASLHGVPVVLVDTAGGGDSVDPLAAEAAVQARRAMESADMILAVVDASRPRDFHSLKLPSGRPAVLAANKIDLAPPHAGDVFGNEPLRVVATSSVTGQGIDELRVELLRALSVSPPEADVALEPRIFNSRQECLLRDALARLNAGSVAVARGSVAEILNGPASPVSG